jgi:hypothetical protein
MQSCHWLFFFLFISIGSSFHLNIAAPNSLKDDFPETKGSNLFFFLYLLVIPATLANMGQIPWGQTISLSLYLSSPYDACSKITTEKSKSNGNSKYALLANGTKNCPVTTKALYAESNGASILVVIYEEENIESLRIVDAIGIVNIPTVVIGRSSGEKMVEILTNNPQNAIQLEFPFAFVGSLLTFVPDSHFWE